MLCLINSFIFVLSSSRRYTNFLHILGWLMELHLWPHWYLNHQWWDWKRWCLGKTRRNKNFENEFESTLLIKCIWICVNIFHVVYFILHIKGVCLDWKRIFLSVFFKSMPFLPFLPPPLLSYKVICLISLYFLFFFQKTPFRHYYMTTYGEYLLCFLFD